MLLVIFGAGASYDSVPHLPPPRANNAAQSNWSPVGRSTPSAFEAFRLPLANQLFEDRSLFVDAMEKFPDCKAIVPLLRTSVPVEQQLAGFEEQARTFPQRRRQLIAIRFYLQTVLTLCQREWYKYHRGITNYATFIDAVERWRYENSGRVCYVTFNYDTMLEQAMSQGLGFNFEHFGRYISDPRYQLIKLHGSVSWGLELEIPQVARSAKELIEHALELTVSNRFRIARTGGAFEDQTFGLPALAIPVENKSEFMCPPEHLQVLGNLLSQVTKLITIGWRATERHFLTMLKKRLTGLPSNIDAMIVSGSSAGAQETLNNLGLTLNAPDKRSLLDAGFTGLIDQIGLLEGFLR